MGEWYATQLPTQEQTDVSETKPEEDQTDGLNNSKANS